MTAFLSRLLEINSVLNTTIKNVCIFQADLTKTYSYLIDVFWGTSKVISRPPAELLELAFPQATSGII